jgi:fumarate reductase (CoM/CoB) subunit B
VLGLVSKLKKYKWIAKLFFSSSLKNTKKLIHGMTHEKQFYEVKNTHVDMKELLKCAICPNMCRFECPVLRVTQKEMYAPATKARLSYHMERGNLDITNLHTAEVAYMCTNCDGCRNWCFMDISTGDLLSQVRADFVDKEIFIPGVKEFNDRVVENQTAFDPDTFSRDSELNVNMEDPEVFYYTGCVMTEKKPEAVKANIKILKKAEIRFCMHSDERICCGGPLATLGFNDTVKDFAQKNLALFNKSGAKIIIADCPACTNTIRNTYKTLGFKHKYEVYTTVEYYRKLIEEGRITPTKPANISITYHDPCISSRGKMGTTDIENSRYIFSRIPDLDFREVYLYGSETQCCGRGGVSHIHHPEVADTIGKQRVAQLKETGGEYIVSACPACEEGFMFNDGNPVLDIGEILARSLED